MVRPAGAVHHKWVEDVPFMLHWPYWLDQAVAACSPMSMGRPHDPIHNTSHFIDCNLEDGNNLYLQNGQNTAHVV